MGVMASFTLRSLSKNRVRSVVCVIGIVLSCALLTAILTSVVSIQAGLLQRTLDTEGSWQVFSPDIAPATLDMLEQDAGVVDVAVARDLGSAPLSEAESATVGEFVVVRTLPQTVKGSFAPGGAPLTLMPELAEGRMPETAGEVILPDYAKGVALGTGAQGEAAGAAGVFSEGPLAIGATLTCDLGRRSVARDGGTEVLNAAQHTRVLPDAAEGRPGETLADAERKAFTVVGFYQRQSPFLGFSFTASASSVVALVGGDPAVSGASGEGGASAYLTVQGFSDVAAMQSYFAGFSDGHGPEFLYHLKLFPYQGISDGRLISDTFLMVAAVLAAVVVVASVSLIYNSFAMSVAQRTRQFGLLASVGASRKQVRRSVLFEALALGLIGIPAGVLVGIAGTAAVFALSQEAFSAALGTEGGLAIRIDPLVVCAAVLLSLLTLLISAWVPASRAARLSALDAIRQARDVRLRARAARKAQRAQKAAPQRLSSVCTSGLAGRVFGVSGFIARQNSMRAGGRGRSVAASLAVSVALVVVAGGLALYLGPVFDRAEGRAGAGGGADISVFASFSTSSPFADNAADAAGFADAAARIEGVSVLGSVKQGQARAVIPAAMMTDAGRSALRGIYGYGQEGALARTAPLTPAGDFVGHVGVFYLDGDSWKELVRGLRLDEGDYSDPDRPRAIALNRYQGSSPEGRYVEAAPFSQAGAIEVYACSPLEGWTLGGIGVDASGTPVVEYISQPDGEGQAVWEERPLAEAGTKQALEVGALAGQVPGILKPVGATGTLPSLILPDSAANTMAGFAAGEEGGAEGPAETGGLSPYRSEYFSFKADDHTKAAAALGELAANYRHVTFHITDIAENAQQSLLVAQAMQLFVFCFALIMVLIAIANVFNTLTNSIMGRTREFALMKSVGMGDGAFVRMLVYECASYALRGLAVGLVCAGGATYLLYRAVSLSFEGMAFTLPWGYVGAAVAIVLAVLALSVVFALHKSHASGVVDALRMDA